MEYLSYSDACRCDMLAYKPAMLLIANRLCTYQRRRRQYPLPSLKSGSKGRPEISDVLVACCLFHDDDSQFVSPRPWCRIFCGGLLRTPGILSRGLVEGLGLGLGLGCECSFALLRCQLWITKQNGGFTAPTHQLRTSPCSSFRLAEVLAE